MAARRIRVAYQLRFRSCRESPRASCDDSHESSIHSLPARTVFWRDRKMASVEKSVEVDVPVNTAYNQWTQFEEFPQFMEGVKEVKQLDDAHLHWRVEIGGKEEQWEAEITSQV